MYSNQNPSYASSQSSGYDSVNYSFSSCSSADTSYTPSTRRESFESTNLDDRTYINYGNPSSYAMSAMSNELTNVPNVPFEIDYEKMPADPAIFNFEHYVGAPNPYSAYHGLQLVPESLPSLVPDLQSPLSEIGPSHDDYINPSQTFINTYDSQSPSGFMKLDSSPMSDYTRSGHSPADSVSFGTYYGPCLEDAKSCSSTPSRSFPMRQPIFEPLETSVALHKVQSDSQERRLHKKLRRESNIFGNNVRFQAKAKKPCTFKGCNQKFQRQEHLKRHEKTHTNSESFPCQFCSKSFGRSDNLKSHIKLHADPTKKSSRTKHFDEAVPVLAEMNRRTKRSTDSKATPSIKPDPDTPSKSMRSRIADFS